MKIGELAVDIKVKGGTQSVATMKQLKATALATKTAMLGLVVAFAKMSQEARKFAMNLDVFETATGISSKALEKMSFRAAAAGVSLESYGETLQSIQQMTRDIALGRGDIAPFQLWNIGLNKDPIKVMDQISARLKQLHQRDTGQAAQMARDFGLSNQMLYVLLQDQTEELEEQYILKKEDQEALVKLNREWYKMWWYVKQIGIRSQGFLAHVALPILKAAVNLTKFVGDLVIGFGEMYQHSVGLQKTIAGIGIVVAGILAYMYPIPATLIAIALVCEDIYGYFNGKDSITGRMAEWVDSAKFLEAVFRTIGEILRGISKATFGPEFTKKVFNFLENKDETGAYKGKDPYKGVGSVASLLLNPAGSIYNALKKRPNLPDFTDFSKLGLAGVAGGMSVTQYNNIEFLQRGAREDGEAAGEFVNKAAVESTALQNPEGARGEQNVS